MEAKGYVQTTIDDIASEIGQSKGAIYHYFGTKEDILYQIHLRSIDSSIAFVRDILNEPISSHERVRHLFHRMLQFIAENRAYSAIFLESRLYIRSSKFDNIREKRAEFEQLIGQVFRQGAQAGELRDVDPRMATLSLLGQLNWALIWYAPAGPLTIADIADIFADIFLNGIDGLSST